MITYTAQYVHRLQNKEYITVIYNFQSNPGAFSEAQK